MAGFIKAGAGTAAGFLKVFSEAPSIIYRIFKVSRTTPLVVNFVMLYINRKEIKLLKQ
jgi:hypothetical protein